MVYRHFSMSGNLDIFQAHFSKKYRALHKWREIFCESYRNVYIQ